MGFSRQEYMASGLPCPPPGDLPDQGIEPVFLMSPALAGGSLPLVPRGKQLRPLVERPMKSSALPVRSLPTHDS